MVVSLSPEWKLPFLMKHHILSHLPPPPPAAERRRDPISLGWNKKICWWKWSDDSLCCTPRNHFWMTARVCVCYHVFHCVGGVSAALVALSQHSFVWAFTHSVDRRTARPRFCGSTQNRREKPICGYFRNLSKAPHEWCAEALLCITAVNTHVMPHCLAGAQTRAVTRFLRDFWWLSGKRCGLWFHRLPPAERKSISQHSLMASVATVGARPDRLLMDFLLDVQLSSQT